MNEPMPPSIHASADVQSNAIGEGTRVWQYVVILPKAKIGNDCNICSHVLIENDVVLGDRVTVKSGVQLWDGTHVEDDVFIGPNTSFSNDKRPRSKHYQTPLRTHIGKGASIGAGAVILPGLTIGQHALIGAGAVVTRSVPAHAIVVGNPARISGYVNTKNSAPYSAADTQVGKMESKVLGVGLYQLPQIADIRGSLTVGEFERSIPFRAKRYFMVFDVPSVETRGEHAHKQCHQFLICVKGTVSVVADDGCQREEFQLSGPHTGLHLPPMVWGIQYKYSPDAVLLVFASHYYDAEDYIRDYSEFLEAVRRSI